MIEVKVLGPLEVVRGQQLVALPGDRERTVLAVLAIHAGETVSADRLIDQLWGEDLPSNAPNALQAIVSRLRRVLDPARIVLTRKPGYAIDTEACEIDSRRFEEVVGRAGELRSDDPAQASALLADALAMWRGTPFADLEFEEVIQGERTRLEDLRASALEDKIEADLALGRHLGTTVADLERLVAAEPFRERPRGQLMLALYRSGRQGDAISTYHEIRRVLSDQLGLDPGPELKQLYDRILHQDPELMPAGVTGESSPRTNLPTRITSFVGRDAEIRELTALIGRNRLVTILGPGGSGKTSLAVEVGRGLTKSFDNGVWLAELGPVSEAGLVDAVGNSVGWSEGTATADRSHALARLCTYVENKQILLLLDNCEHVVQASAELADAVLRACPGISILATSREVLASSGEFVWTIPPLLVPVPEADPAELSSYDSVRLLVDRAASAGGGSFDDGESAAAAAEICRRLDGMPLAIELAAVRARSLPLREIARRLDRRFELLTAGGRTIEPRHRTLRAAIDWSYELLTDEERTLFRYLSVFTGGWTLDAAEHVCSEGPVRNVIDVFLRLVDQSLIVARGERFRMLETIESYARERLSEAGEEDALRDRHATFFTNLAVETERDLRSPQQAAALSRLRAEEHNLKGALRWGRDHAGERPDAGLSLAAALGWYWYVGRQVDGRSELESMLRAASGASPVTRARALQSWSLALRPAGCIVHPNPAAAIAARESLLLFEREGEPVRAALSRLLVAVEGVSGEDIGGYLDMVAEARVDLGTNDDAWGLALADFVEMEIRLYHGSPDQALALGEQAAAQFDALDDLWGRSAVRLHLGIGLRLAGHTSQSRRLLHEAVSLSQETGLPNNLARSLAELAELALHIGDPDEAEQWLDRCQKVVTDLADDTLQSLIFTCRADSARFKARPSAARDDYQQALVLCRRNNLAREQARALTGLAAAELDLGNIAAAEGALDETARLLGTSHDPAVHAASLEQLARLAFTRSALDKVAHLLREAELVRTDHQRPRSALAESDVAATALL